MVTVELPTYNIGSHRKDGGHMTISGAKIHLPSEAVELGIINKRDMKAYKGEHIISKDGHFWAAAPPEDIKIKRR